MEMNVPLVPTPAGPTSDITGPPVPEVPQDEPVVEPRVLEQEEVTALAHKLSMIDVMLDLQKDFFREEFAGKKKKKRADGEDEDAPLFLEVNPGCWIFGHGEVVDLPHEFSNPVLVSQFCCTLILVMLCCTAFRTFWICLGILVKPIHDYMYAAKFYQYPLLALLFLHFILSVFTHLTMFRKYLYVPPFNLIAFFFVELSFTGVQVCLSLALERAVQVWHVSLDLYDDYKNEGYDPLSPEFWHELQITPGILIIIGNLQIFFNLTCVLCMHVYTKAGIGSRDMNRMLFGQTCFTTFLNMILIRSLSYRVSPVWDSFQIFMACVWSAFTSFLFVHYLDRIVRGQTLRLRGMRWTDICYSALRICFV